MSASAADLTATLETTKGKIVLKLTPDQTPVTVANFVNLIKRGFYDGITFHRVIPDFMVQCGDPAGTGSGGPGYSFKDEFNPTLRHDKPGVLSMANRGENTNGSQFFITHVPTPWLDDKHTVFGNVVTGQDVVNAIKQGDKITKATISGDVESLLKSQSAQIAQWNATLDPKFPSKAG